MSLITLLVALVGSGILIFAVTPVRRRLVSRPLLRWFRKVLPPISDTEKAAIDAGTTWWDADLFGGTPDWNKLHAVPASKLNANEQAFVDGPVDELCEMLDNWQIDQQLNDLPPEVWRFMKSNGFFGMIIPTEYGGLGFSPRAQSEVVMKIATRSISAAITVMVPNSLGPGELLLHYGTDEQKSHYLPRLASGKDIPAFALTNPHAGSDAGAMPDTGIACYAEYQGKQTPGFRVNWQKRYITLGPVCTVLGLAFQATDPDGILGDRKKLGITCALIPSGTRGVTIGERHAPGGAFQNGPNSGSNVFVPLDWIIGGQQQIGQGWKMLMNCLSVGRAISLPALGTAAGKLASLTTGAYARIRRQFNTPIGRFEGVAEALARIGGLTYRMDAARTLTATALNEGQKPSVLSAILKYHNTEGMRQVINDALDVHAGRGVCDGPSNYLQSTYRAVPVAITVEGANILTRSMIIFGQGAIRCHPYVFEEMLAAAETDDAAALARFDRVVFRHIGHTTMNACRSLFHGLSAGRFARAPKTRALRRFYRQLSLQSAGFAFLADIAMLVLGGELKRRERLSARFGDVLSHLYMASAVLKRFQDEGGQAADLPFVEWALMDSLHTIDDRIAAILDNFPSRWLAAALTMVVRPLGRRYRVPGDRLCNDVAALLMTPSDSRDRLIQGAFVNADPRDPVRVLQQALTLVDDAEATEGKIRRHTNAGRSITAAQVQAAIDDGIINDLERVRLQEFQHLLDAAIAVDQFEKTSQRARNSAGDS